MRLTCSYRDLPPAYYYDEAAAQRVVDYVQRYCRHWQGHRAGQPFALSDEQKEHVIKPLFGVKRRSDGLRRYRRGLISTARKWGKSMLVSALTLYMITADEEGAPEALLMANSQTQAKDIFRAIDEMVRAHPYLRRNVESYTASVSCAKTNGKALILTNSPKSGDGRNASFGVYDESGECVDPAPWEKIVTSSGTRLQPLMLMVSTAGEHDPTNVLFREREYAERVCAGLVEDDAFFFYVCAADDDLPIDSEEAWRQANPHLGDTVQLDFLRGELVRAQNDPTYVPVFTRYYLNRYVDASGVAAWCPLDRWDACAGEVDLEDLKGRPCFAGLDLSSRRDVTCVVLDFPPAPDPDGETTNRYVVAAWAWVPRANVDDRRTPWTSWALAHPERYMVTEGNTVDHEAVFATVQALCDRFDVRELAYDPHNVGGLAVRIESELNVPCVEMKQGYWLSEDVENFLDDVLERRIAHGGDPMLRHMVHCAAAKRNEQGRVKLLKDHSRGRIDGVIAAVMAHSRARGAPEPSYDYSDAFGVM
ncbi:MAG: hypothetical protein GHCLOJNM_01580 [bacterium]|nr:hypothetical protein [bacterium]